MKRNQVFVSYSHADSEHLLRMRVHLRPFERQSLVDVWADTKIKAGQHWKKEIAAALDRAAVAILLISADFLASEYVAENELPPLLAAAKADGVQILPVVLKPCAFTSIEALGEFQAVNDPNKPLIALTEVEKESLWVNVAQTVQAALKEFSAASGAVPIDESTYEYFDSFPWAHELIRDEITNPKCVRDYEVYEYQHVDILEFMPPASAVLQGVGNANEVLAEVAYALRAGGWEGDGTIRILWIPPFMGAGSEDTWGIAAWFVKQSNNGTSFIASPVPLPFSRLLEQQL